MNVFTDIEEKRISPSHFPLVILTDCSAGVKYAFGKENGLFFADKMFACAVSGVASGFIPRTFDENGNPLEILLLCAKAIIPMSLVEAQPIGTVTFENGDEKIIAVPIFDSFYGEIGSIEHIDINVFSNIERFYNLCENSGAIVKKDSRQSAEYLAKQAMLRFHCADNPERWLR